MTLQGFDEALFAELFVCGVVGFGDAIAVEEKAGEMAAIGVAQVARGVVVFGKEESGERAVGRIVAKELIHGAHKALRLVQSEGALAAQVGLEIGHQESGGNSFSGDVADHESKPLLS